MPKPPKPPKPKPDKKDSGDVLTDAGFKTDERDAILESTASPRIIFAEPQAIDPGLPASRNPILVIGPAANFVNAERGGQIETYPDVDVWSKSTGNLVRTVDPSTSETDTLRAYMNFDSLEQWVTDFSAEVKNYEVFFEIVDPNAACPLSGSGETWNQWEVNGDSGKPIPLTNPDDQTEYWYRNNGAYLTNQGVPVDATTWVQYIGLPDTGNTSINAVRTVEEFVVISEANTPEPVATTGTGRKRGRRR